MGAEMNEVLIVCYSYTGTSHRLAQMLGRALNWPLAEIHDAKPRSGAWGTWRCVVDSLLRRRPPMRYAGPDPGQFDAVVLVSPIWAGRLAGPMRSFVALHRDRLRDVAIVSTMDERGAENAVAEVGHLLGRAPLMSMAVTAREVDDGSCAARLDDFGKAVQTAEDTKPGMRSATLSPRAA